MLHNSLDGFGAEGATPALAVAFLPGKDKILDANKNAIHLYVV